MGWRPGPGSGTGADPDRGPGLPGGAPPGRDPRLTLFAGDGSQAGPVRQHDGDVQPEPRDCPCGDSDGGCQPDHGRGDPGDGSDCRDGDADDHGDHIRDRSHYGHGDDDDAPDDRDDPDVSGDDDDGGGSGSGGPGPRPGVPPTGPAHQRHPADLAVPLTTVLGLAERPGEIQGFGLLDPALARKLAAAAAASPRTEVCLTVTSPEGYAIGHGCARPSRTPQPPAPATASSGHSPPGLPARLNLTVSATALSGLSSPTGHSGPWAFAPRGNPGSPGGTGPSDGYGTWTLTLPGGGRLTVRLDPVPTFECDHRYESHGYQPGDKLRHLVQVRDGTCTFPSCNRHARASDFEHALPYHKGGKTCTCNAGARSRACHRIKQSPGWNVTQPKPGWHQWTTPAGRTYLQEPWRYPA
jgi:hypothetical protein